PSIHRRGTNLLRLQRSSRGSWIRIQRAIAEDLERFPPGRVCMRSEILFSILSLLLLLECNGCRFPRQETNCSLTLTCSLSEVARCLIGLPVQKEILQPSTVYSIGPLVECRNRARLASRFHSPSTYCFESDRSR